MPQYIGGGIVSNPYSDTVSGGFIPGDAATGWLQRDLKPFMDALEPKKAPLVSMITKRDTTTQLKTEWGLKRVRPHKTTLNAALTTGTTTLNLGTTNIKLTQKYMVFRIIDPTLGDEIVWSNADPNIGAGTIAIVRSQGGTTDPGATHASGLTVEIIGTAEPMTGVDHAISPYLYGDQAFNYIQRFAGGPKMDRTARYTPDLERKGDKLLGLIAEESDNLLIQLEKAVMLGGRQQGVPGTPTPPLMGGLRFYIGTLDSGSFNIRTVSGLLSIFDIEQITADVWGRYTDNVATKIVCNMTTKRIVNRLINGLRDAQADTTKLALKLDNIALETGNFDFMVHPWMPDGEMWGINFDGCTLTSYNGEGNGTWHTEVNASAGSYDWRTIVGLYSLKVEGEPSMWRVTGFDTTLGNYPTAAL